MLYILGKKKSVVKNQRFKPGSKLQQAQVNVFFWGSMSTQHIHPFLQSNEAFAFTLSGRKQSPLDRNKVTSLCLQLINY